ncbi:BTAD domain-containing putative transcriptional regulator [Kribbella sp. NPDC056951]|uniref:BTAD domain-containing putative transcriptional regulator n=1 Tax=Kribbella sp. NPDC056951 TaxID=3345978 RepID=UPI00362742BE
MSPSGDGEFEIRVLGPTEVRVRDETFCVERPLERALLVRLALARGHGVPDETLAADLWGEGQVDKPTERLRVLIYRLRKALGAHAAAVHRAPNGYALRGRLADLLAVENELLAIRAARRSGESGGIVRAAAAALAQWRGPAFADVRETPYGAAEAARLESLHLDLLTDRLEAELALGTIAVSEVDQLARRNPLNERLVGLSVVALYRAGRQAEALARVADLRRELADQLGIDPSPASLELELRLLRQDPSLLARDVRPAEDAGTSMIGRGAEVTALLDRLRQPAVVTLTGGPGVGKTRLAREVANLVAHPGRPVVWLDLSRLGRGDAVLPSLAAATRSDGSGADLLALCVSRLAGALLVLDGAEHVLDPVADLLAAVAEEGDRVSVLVTSQRPVRVSAEEVRPVGPLSRADAIRLFQERCEVGSDDDAELVDTICTAVDRYPLAIELAAGLTRTLTVQQIAQRIEYRLRLLVGGARSAGGRHSSLRTAIDWSCALLDPFGQALLHRVAVFAGGFTLEAAEEVVCGNEPQLEAADVAPLLADLYDRSLVTITVEPEGHRFGLLQSIRDYALEGLVADGNEMDIRRRHADWCAALAARTERYGGGDHELLVGELSQEEANLRSAVQWSLETPGEAYRVLGIVAPAWWYWWGHGRLVVEARDWLHRALEIEEEAPPRDRAVALRATASLTRNSGDAVGALALGERALAIFRSLGDDRGCVSTMVGLCISNIALAKFETALDLALEVTELAEFVGEPRLLGTAINVTGAALRGLDRLPEAEERFEAAVELWQRIDDRRALAGTLGNLGLVYQRTGDLDRSRERLRDALHLYREIDLTEGIIDIVELVAGLEVAAGRHWSALRMLTVAGTQRIRLGVPLIIADELEARNLVEETARSALGADADAVVAASLDDSLAALADELLDSLTG